ncbi:MAG: endonuclease [Bacilli bacterium]|nr:endonuclease [Bacilli bacterium]
MKIRKLFLPIVLLTSFVSGCSNSIVESSSTPSSSSSSAPTTSSSSSQSSSSSSQSSSNSSSSSSVTTGDIITEEGRKEYNGYYSKIDNSLTGGMNGTLRTTLTSFIAPKAYFTYSGSGSGQLGKELCSIDEDPSNPDNMILFYTQKSIKKEVSGDGTWNREHVWPQSLSGNLYGKTEGGCDALHIRPTYISTNSARGNLKYKDCPTGEVLKYQGVSYAKKSGNFFEPQDSVKGDCARICLYMWVTYFASRNTPLTNVTDSVETLVRWSNEDLPDAKEKLRNDRVQASKQKNRNPFVDHPEWVNIIFG